ncbi:hypothetical protein RCL1_008372 [Eukaryota sp. TZLM3-RCL]
MSLIFQTDSHKVSTFFQTTTDWSALSSFVHRYQHEFPIELCTFLQSLANKLRKREMSSVAILTHCIYPCLELISTPSALVLSSFPSHTHALSWIKTNILKLSLQLDVLQSVDSYSSSSQLQSFLIECRDCCRDFLVLSADLCSTETVLDVLEFVFQLIVSFSNVSLPFSTGFPDNSSVHNSSLTATIIFDLLVYFDYYPDLFSLEFAQLITDSYLTGVDLFSRINDFDRAHKLIEKLKIKLDVMEDLGKSSYRNSVLSSQESELLAQNRSKMIAKKSVISLLRQSSVNDPVKGDLKGKKEVKSPTTAIISETVDPNFELNYLLKFFEFQILNYFNGHYSKMDMLSKILPRIFDLYSTLSFTSSDIVNIFLFSKLHDISFETPSFMIDDEFFDKVSEFCDKIKEFESLHDNTSLINFEKFLSCNLSGNHKYLFSFILLKFLDGRQIFKKNFDYSTSSVYLILQLSKSLEAAQSNNDCLLSIIYNSLALSMLRSKTLLNQSFYSLLGITDDVISPIEIAQKALNHVIKVKNRLVIIAQSDFDLSNVFALSCTPELYLSDFVPFTSSSTLFQLFAFYSKLHVECLFNYYFALLHLSDNIVSSFTHQSNLIGQDVSKLTLLKLAYVLIRGSRLVVGDDLYCRLEEELYVILSNLIEFYQFEKENIANFISSDKFLFKISARMEGSLLLSKSKIFTQNSDFFIPIATVSTISSVLSLDSLNSATANGVFGVGFDHVMAQNSLDFNVINGPCQPCYPLAVGYFNKNLTSQIQILGKYFASLPLSMLEILLKFSSISFSLGFFQPINSAIQSISNVYFNNWDEINFNYSDKYLTTTLNHNRVNSSSTQSKVAISSMISMLAKISKSKFAKSVSKISKINHYLSLCLDLIGSNCPELSTQIKTIISDNFRLSVVIDSFPRLGSISNQSKLIDSGDNKLLLLYKDSMSLSLKKLAQSIPSKISELFDFIDLLFICLYRSTTDCSNQFESFDEILTILTKIESQLSEKVVTTDSSLATKISKKSGKEGKENLKVKNVENNDNLIETFIVNYFKRKQNRNVFNEKLKARALVNYLKFLLTLNSDFGLRALELYCRFSTLDLHLIKLLRLLATVHSSLTVTQSRVLLSNLTVILNQSNLLSLSKDDQILFTLLIKSINTHSSTTLSYQKSNLTTITDQFVVNQYVVSRESSDFHILCWRSRDGQSNSSHFWSDWIKQSKLMNDPKPFATTLADVSLLTVFNQNQLTSSKYQSILTYLSSSIDACLTVFDSLVNLKPIHQTDCTLSSRSLSSSSSLVSFYSSIPPSCTSVLLRSATMYAALSENSNQSNSALYMTSLVLLGQAAKDSKRPINVIDCLYCHVNFPSLMSSFLIDGSLSTPQIESFLVFICRIAHKSALTLLDQLNSLPIISLGIRLSLLLPKNNIFYEILMLFYSFIAVSLGFFEHGVNILAKFSNYDLAGFSDQKVFDFLTRNHSITSSDDLFSIVKISMIHHFSKRSQSKSIDCQKFIDQTVDNLSSNCNVPVLLSRVVRQVYSNCRPELAVKIINKLCSLNFETINSWSDSCLFLSHVISSLSFQSNLIELGCMICFDSSLFNDHNILTFFNTSLSLKFSVLTGLLMYNFDENLVNNINHYIMNLEKVLFYIHRFEISKLYLLIAAKYLSQNNRSKMVKFLSSSWNLIVLDLIGSRVFDWSDDYRPFLNCPLISLALSCCRLILLVSDNELLHFERISSQSNLIDLVVILFSLCPPFIQSYFLDLKLKCEILNENFEQLHELMDSLFPTYFDVVFDCLITSNNQNDWKKIVKFAELQSVLKTVDYTKQSKYQSYLIDRELPVSLGHINSLHFLSNFSILNSPLFLERSLSELIKLELGLLNLPGFSKFSIKNLDLSNVDNFLVWLHCPFNAIKMIVFNGRSLKVKPFDSSVLKRAVFEFISVKSLSLLKSLFPSVLSFETPFYLTNRTVFFNLDSSLIDQIVESI